MKKIIVWSLLLCGSSAYAESFQGFPTQIRTTSEGASFVIHCAPSKLSIIEEMKQLSLDLKSKLDQIHCDVIKIRNPIYRCTSTAIGDPVCANDKVRFVQLSGQHPNYLAILNLVTASYLSQNQVSFDVSKVSESATEITYDLQQVSLE
jgi:hypothetical protein